MNTNAPVLPATSLREEYAHVAKQRCHCGSNFAAEGERMETDALTGHPVHVLEAVCLNPDCGKRATFKFATGGLLLKGLGRALVEQPDPAALWQDLPAGHRAAVRLTGGWLAARAAGLARPALDALAAEAAASLGAADAADALAETLERDLWPAYARIAGFFDARLGAAAPPPPAGGARPAG